jgi:hypothetical protein
VSNTPAVVHNDEQLTIKQFQRVLPKGVKAKLTSDMVNSINGVISDPGIRDNYRDNLLSYTNVMQDGKYKIQSYIDAVRYVSHKLMGSSNVEAYTKTFPSRYQRVVTENKHLEPEAIGKILSSYVAAYNKTKLVVKVFEQTLVPSHILNADMYQKALNRQAYLMTHANSEKVQSDAANSLLTHLKMPEVNKIELDIGLKQDKSIDLLREATVALAKAQQESIKKGGHTAHDIAQSAIVVEAEFQEVIDE